VTGTTASLPSGAIAGAPSRFNRHIASAVRSAADASDAVHTETKSQVHIAQRIVKRDHCDMPLRAIVKCIGHLKD
jgi:hypothetical protein